MQQVLIHQILKKIDLANLISNADKLDIDKVVSVPIDLNKVSDVVKMILLKSMYIKLR